MSAYRRGYEQAIADARQITEDRRAVALRAAFAACEPHWELDEDARRDITEIVDAVLEAMSHA